MAPEDLENARLEYKAIESTWRYFAGLRFIIVAALVALQTGLMTVFSRLSEAPVFETQVAQIGIIITGFFSVWAVWIIERRTYHFDRLTIERGVELEKELKRPSGIFQRYWVRPQNWRRLTTHTAGFFFLFILLALFWVALYLWL